jgi:hypothetical protein
MRDTKFCPIEERAPLADARPTTPAGLPAVATAPSDVVAASAARRTPAEAPEPLIVAPLRAGDVMAAHGTTRGKTAFALSLAFAVAQGRAMFHRRTPKDRALFVTFGPGDSYFGYQARALNRRYGVADNLRMLHLPFSGLNCRGAWGAVVDAAREQCPALIVIDSLYPATLPGADRIDGRDPIMSAARHLSASVGGASIFSTHHTGTTLGRIGSRLHDALDAADEMSRPRGHGERERGPEPMVRRLTKPGKNWLIDCEMIFDAAAFGLDANDEPITAAVAIEIGAEVTE